MVQQIGTVSGSPNFTVSYTYEIFGATVTTVAGNANYTVASPCSTSALPTYGWTTDAIGTNGNQYRILIPGSGMGVGARVQSVTGNTIGGDTNAGNSLTAASANVVISSGWSWQGGSTTTSVRGTPNAYACGTVAVAVNNATITVPSGMFATTTDQTSGGVNGAYYTAIRITDPSGTCPAYSGILLSGGTTTGTVSPAPTCAISGPAEVWWGPSVFQPTDVGKYIEVPNYGGAGVHRISTVSAFKDPAHLVLSSNAAQTIYPGVNFSNTEITYGPDDTAAVLSMAQNAYAKGIRMVKWPAGVNTFMATASMSTLTQYLWTEAWCGDGQIYWPKSLNIPRVVSHECDNGTAAPPPQNTINPGINLRQTLAAVSPVIAFWPGDSLLAEDSNGSPNDYLANNLRSSLWAANGGNASGVAGNTFAAFVPYQFSVGGTVFADADPNGPNHGNGVGIPGGATSSFSSFYTNVASKWYTYPAAKNPSLLLTRIGPNDGVSMLAGSVLNVFALPQSSAWGATHPDQLYITDSYFGAALAGGPSASFQAADYEAGFIRSGIRACSLVTMANGGCLGMIDLGCYRKAFLYGWCDGFMPTARANYLGSMSLDNATNQFNSPYVWPVPVYGIAPNVNYIVYGVTTPAAYWASVGSLYWTTGNGAIATPTAQIGNTAGLNLLPTGGKVSLGYASGTGDYTITATTWDVSETVTFTGTTTSQITCSAACTNMFYQGTTGAGASQIDIAGMGTSGGTCTSTIGTINAAGTVINLLTPCAQTKASGSGTLRFYRTTINSFDTGVAAACVSAGGNCSMQLIYNGRDDGYTSIQVASTFQSAPVFEGYIERLGSGYTQPTMGWTGTVSAALFQTNGNSPATNNQNSGEYRPETGTIYNVTMADSECWGVNPGYSGQYFGANNAHPSTLCGAKVQREVFNSLNLMLSDRTSPTRVMSGSGLAKCGQTLLVNSASAPTISLPSQCSPAQPVTVLDFGGQAGAATITLTVPGGTTLNGTGAGSTTITAAYGKKTIQYSGLAAVAY